MGLLRLTFSLGKRATIIFQLLFLIAASYPCAASTMLVHPYLRNIVSQAACQSGYEWMNNQEGNGPCSLVAYIIAACVGNSWTQPALPAGYHYDPPNGSTATPCYCSWSCYNLMMACTYCQSSNATDQLMTWPTFIQDCKTSYTEEYFPSGYTLLASQTIPYWATVDPTSWQGQIWNEEQAFQDSQEGQPDLQPSVSSGSHSSDLGAIVGGTVGGAAFLLLLALGIYILYKRRRYRRLQTTPVAEVNGVPNPSWQAHNRQLSDQSTTSVLQQSTMSAMTYYTGSGTQMMYSSPPPRVDTASYNTSGTQSPPVLPII
ncbi:hypothetical protein EDC04DRAFT_1406119 [Pisolithus marmoratus]|nr:hypothetical protein EDC04DRAFT_1406119 [Pisolithus marmoratus]